MRNQESIKDYSLYFFILWRLQYRLKRFPRLLQGYDILWSFTTLYNVLCSFCCVSISYTLLLILWSNRCLVKNWTLFPLAMFFIARIRVRVLKPSFKPTWCFWTFLLDSLTLLTPHIWIALSWNGCHLDWWGIFGPLPCWSHTFTYKLQFTLTIVCWKDLTKKKIFHED